MERQERYWQAKKVTVLSAIVNFLLGAIKIAGGIIFNSHALVADGIHSFSDLLTDAMVIFASKYGSQAADESHPYGHQRIETAATLFLAMILILAGAAIGWGAFEELITAHPEIPGILSLPIACLSIIANELLFHYTKYVGKKIKSHLIITNAWHHRSDAASSVIVLAGLIGSVYGWAYFDALAAIVVGLLIIKMGWEYGWNSVKELVDTAVDPLLLKEIERIIENVDGVEKIHQLRSRFMGNDIFIDVHILVRPRISVSEGHYIAQHVHEEVTKHIKRITDVIVHVDPEDDEIICPSLHLPNREQLQENFLNEVKSHFPEIEFYNLHYQEGALTIDVIVSKEFTELQTLKMHLQKIIMKYGYLKEFRLMTLEKQIVSAVCL